MLFEQMPYKWQIVIAILVQRMFLNEAYPAGPPSDHQRNTIVSRNKWCFAGRPMVAHF